MERLRELYEELGAPSVDQLRYAALQDGLQVSMQQIQTFVRQQPENQIFQDKPDSEGLTASRGPDQEWQIDLIDLKQFDNSNKVILVAMDPFSRKIALEGLPSKRPEVVAGGFKKILERWPKPAAVSHDNGNEWKNAFANLLRTEGIVYKLKRSINSLGRVDRAILGLKKQLFKRLARQGNLKFDKIIPQLETAYNKSKLKILGMTPDQATADTKRGRVERFKLLQDSAEAFEHNHALTERKMEDLKEKGAFRQVLGSTAFDRAFKPNYGPKREVQGVERGQVTDTQGRKFAVNEVLVIDKETADAPVPDMRGRGLRDKRLQDNLQTYARDLWDALGDNEIALTAASRLMSEEFARARPSTLLFSDFVRLFPTLFSISGSGPGMRVRRAPRRRIRGKQPAP
jgi:hypothetical protein